MRRVVDEYHSRKVAVAQDPEVLDVGHPGVHLEAMLAIEFKGKDVAFRVDLVEKSRAVVFLTGSQNSNLKLLTEPFQHFLSMGANLEIDTIVALLSRDFHDVPLLFLLYSIQVHHLRVN